MRVLPIVILIGLAVVFGIVLVAATPDQPGLEVRQGGGNRVVKTGGTGAIPRKKDILGFWPGMTVADAVSLIKSSELGCEGNTAPLGGTHFYCRGKNGVILQIFWTRHTAVVPRVAMTFVAGGSQADAVQAVATQYGVTFSNQQHLPDMMASGYVADLGNGIVLQLVAGSQYNLVIWNPSLYAAEEKAKLENEKAQRPVPRF